MANEAKAKAIGAWRFEHFVEACIETAVEDGWRMGTRANRMLPPVICLHYDAVTQELFDRYAK